MPIKPKPPAEPQRPPGTIPPDRPGMLFDNDGGVSRLLPEWGNDLGGIERESAGIINEMMYPEAAIYARWREAQQLRSAPDYPPYIEHANAA